MLKNCLVKVRDNYKPQTAVSKNDMIKLFYNMKMDKMIHNPRTFLDGMEKIKQDLDDAHKYKMSNVDFISHILSNLRYEYDTVVTKDRMENEEDKDVDIEDLGKRLQAQFELYWK